MITLRALLTLLPYPKTLLADERRNNEGSLSRLKLGLERSVCDEAFGSVREEEVEEAEEDEEERMMVCLQEEEGEGREA